MSPGPPDGKEETAEANGQVIPHYNWAVIYLNGSEGVRL
jgi:hypothetical protein